MKSGQVVILSATFKGQISQTKVRIADGHRNLGPISRFDQSGALHNGRGRWTMDCKANLPSPGIIWRSDFAFEVASTLHANGEAVWKRISTPEGINDELWPLQMSFPVDSPSLDQMARGEQLFRSWVTLAGIFPIDRHAFGLLEIKPGHSFHECSTSWLMRRWVHRRSIDPRPSGSILRDHVEGTMRFWLLGRILAPIYLYIFRRRHRRLQRQFGGDWLTERG